MSSLPKDDNGWIVQQPFPWGVNQTVAIGTASAAIANAVGADTTLVRLIATSDCHVAFGTAPTAATSDPLLVANKPEYVGIKPGEKVAVIQNAAAGTLHVTEVA